MVDKLLNTIALKITQMVSTMYCAIIFTLIACISLPAALSSHSVLVIINWFAQTFLQLVLLSIIMVGQKLQTEHTKTIHETIKQHHKEHMDALTNLSTTHSPTKHERVG